MPIKVIKNLPAITKLAQENIFVMDTERAENQQIRPLQILLVNLMPTKEVTETQILRALSNSPLQVNLTLLQSMPPQKAVQILQAVHLTLHSTLLPFYKFAHIHVTMPLSLHFLAQHQVLPGFCIYFAVFSSVSIYTFGICIEASYLTFWLL